MVSVVRIILDLEASNKAKGNCFESLIRNLLSIHQYEIRSNINFSGMEIDLVAEHKHNKETLYVECKAKEKVSSDELSKFAFNVDFKEIDKGYFFRTQELESQAGALLSEMKQKDKYKNLTFFEPSNMIDMLIGAKMIYEPLQEISSYLIPKRILAITFFGDFFIYLINESNALPTKFIVIDAKNNLRKIGDENVQLLKDRISEISSLALIHPSTYKKSDDGKDLQQVLETISEVQESENWFDYLPASSEKKHFVGRVEIRTKILGFFKEIREELSGKRIFYLNGKSGWGKSSLVLEIKDRCSNVHYRKKFFAIAIDTRSATSDNFVALSFKKLINRAIQQKFITSNMFQGDISFTSTTDLLSSDGIISVMDSLKAENKFLVLIFDQFEDVFRKKDFFKTFYKFLTDVTDKRPNLIIGFSWKSDFLIQSDDPSYHVWQQAKEQAREFNVGEFGESEIDGIIRQLEGSIGSLDKGIRDRIKESSQGLPWLTKKLCIHIFNQIDAGLALENLIESNLNIVDLFTKDAERLSAAELKAIKLIAKRAYDGNFFDETEVGDIIDGSTITSLTHQRLIIRSGANYNIYWDIYRDYLVTDKVPIIGESFLIRQGVKLCLDVFLVFERDKEFTMNELLSKYDKGISLETFNNILIELRNLGLVRKSDNGYSVDNSLEINREGFINFITAKFQNYTPYLYLKKNNLQKIGKAEMILALKVIFKQDFQDNTWNVYATNLITWFLFSNIDIKNRFVEPVKGRGVGQGVVREIDTELFIPRCSFHEISEVLPLLLSDISLIDRPQRDLVALGVLNSSRTLTEFGQELVTKSDTQIMEILRQRILEFPKVNKVNLLKEAKKKLTAKDLISRMPKDFFPGDKESSKTVYASKVLSWLKVVE